MSCIGPKYLKPLVTTICREAVPAKLIRNQMENTQRRKVLKKKEQYRTKLIFKCNRETHYDLRNAWEQTLLKSDILNRREKTFMVICEQLQNQSFTSHQVHPVDPGELIAIQEMENKICKALQSYENRCDSAEEQDMIKNYKQCLLWCCFVLKNRGMFWKSVVKIMVQFVDLWMP